MEGKLAVETFEVIIKEGWLEKRSRFLKGWRKRWIILTPNFLTTLKSQGDYSNSTEQIPLNEFRSILPSDMELNRENTFKIETIEREFFFTAETKAERDEWVSVLGQIMIHTGLTDL